VTNPRRRPALGLLLLGLAALSAAALAQAEPDAAMKQAAGRLAVAMCATCHGADGRGDDPRVPRLAGQQRAYLFIQMQSMRTRQRNNPAMHGPVQDLTDADVIALAAYLQAK
jgi:cytochrome c553